MTSSSASPQLVVDLGRHGALAAAVGPSGHPDVVPLGETGDRFVLRWYGDHGAQRVFEAVRTLQQEGRTGGGEILRAVARALADRLADRGVDPSTHTTRLAVPASRTRPEVELAMAAFGSAGFRLAPFPFVPRPLAALAGWMAHEQVDGVRTLILVDNDAGDLGLAGVDLLHGRVASRGPVVQLCASPAEGLDRVAERLRCRLGAADPHDETRWALTGRPHPLVERLVDEVAPWWPRQWSTAVHGEWLVCAGLFETGWLERLLPQPFDHVQPELGGKTERLDVDPLVVTVEPPHELGRIDLVAE